LDFRIEEQLTSIFENLPVSEEFDEKVCPAMRFEPKMTKKIKETTKRVACVEPISNLSTKQ
jgi:hypothetical protein